MAVVDQLERSRFDTRGLPEGFDPHYFYEYHFPTLVNSATGVESFAYKYIPWSLLRSFAFAIDPTARFKVSPKSITAVNRTKYRQTASVLQLRTHTQHRNRQTWAPIPNYNGVSNCWSPYLLYSTPINDTYSGGLRQQDPLPDRIKDTTSRTRVFGSEQGEFEMFKHELNSPPRTVRSGSKNTGIYPNTGYLPTDPCVVIAHGSPYNRDGGFDLYEDSQSPSGSVLPLTTYNALVASETAYSKALCQKNAIPMLKGIGPFNRDYTLFRNLVELRDIPRSVLSLKDTLGNLRKLYASLSSSPHLRKIIFDLKKTSKDIPNEYLSFHFGWKQTYKDINDLLEAPTKMTKKINFLIARSGKPTTFRSVRKFESAESDVSGFEYDISGLEYGYPFSKSRLERSSEVRLVMNAIFDFPGANVPVFKRGDFLLRMGAVPRVTDLYNLVPWTWLVDWFTGFGNYLELIENINHDQSIVNWGMITCVTKGRLVTDFHSKSDTVTSVYTNPGSIVTTEVSHNYHTSVCDYTCETRSDVATILDVKLTSVPSSLTAFQKSILGALLAQRTGHSGKSTFRVSS